MLAACPWLPPTSAATAAAASASSGAGQAAALRAALLQCARNSGHGQGGIVQPMVQLAVALIEAGGSGAGLGGSKARAALAAAAAVDASEAPAAQQQQGEGGGGGEEDGGPAAAPGQRAAALGARLLLELFEAHAAFRKDIVILCHNRLIGAKVSGVHLGWLEAWRPAAVWVSGAAPAHHCPPPHALLRLPACVKPARAGGGGRPLHPPAVPAGAAQPGHGRR